MSVKTFYRRFHGTLNLSSILPKKSLVSKKPSKDIHPKHPVRTRFAPSPTGLLHMGSLRTALYNYLLAKNTGGQFILRLEDTDQSRLVEGAEENIYDSLRWCKLHYDEGPMVGGPFGPYRQSERTEIYRSYIGTLLESGHAYRCFCPKERLEDLRESARKLQPPTTASYDRHCAHMSPHEIKQNLDNDVAYTIRLRAPEKYPIIQDLLHGTLDIQPQVNANDVRYDDPILVKSDNLPTYHFANVIDDHLMEITHVIRGEEWLPSTQKHLAIYNAFGWSPPQFIHIPLLTTTEDKKLSKRKGDSSVINLKRKGILPEALVNFSVLFGWSPPRDLAAASHECLSLEQFEQVFNLNYLTKGNAKVDEKKLWFFNKHYLQLQLESQLPQVAEQVIPLVQSKYGSNLATDDKVTTILQKCGKALTTIYEFNDTFSYFFERPNYDQIDSVQEYLAAHDLQQAWYILQGFQDSLDATNAEKLIKQTAEKMSISKRPIFECLRFALAGSKPGAKIPVLVDVLGLEETHRRLDEACKYLENRL
ncbi:ZYRO0D05808p [Zygosaccharomyces rouxii]|uniref:Glutamate--tRNA ligase, mitochondrial n=1 Tax=Zygosaccharomyces rouxii (strain ATCC 2623 / CBS 732 / NBRC 1130 / NCYC 568 / NRRL Y-229) TaxID=559307 RepID=C5DVD5_ZYGRC|nr:uncharacterized protein ZYRO0D05808g [Zygosaccharomyces rouxii]KAH9200667.1 tRNA synthetases class I, catalytic domain-containing protein [Zygosaccharomyces rouxii]CAR27754.1 ZYRO0D05808p [Zygosaccharomyces rouxii]